MKAQEDVHLAKLNTLLPEKRVRPTALLPIWHVAGYALGVGTALLGKEAAMACTVAVEEVITDHYNDQLRELHSDPKLQQENYIRELIKKNRDEEMEHRDIGIEHNAQQAPLYSALTAVIKVGCHAAIWLSKRV
eukprot:TRINITY_DN2824_c0_g1_i2.p1 TRINITY_DN2824_c0_g1~~TRINITY_DN2824_c0_g1_i2.p1  ORF type:complete len:134 (-),score=20.63 TRINITY_DN2824_c0_g1_i2:55-456(-)